MADAPDGICIKGKFFDFETCEEINLPGRRLKDDDIASLCANLGRFKRLKSIHFAVNDLSDVGGRAIAEGLMGNCSVTQVDLGRNDDVSDAVKRHITQCLLQSNGADKGIAAAGTCTFFDFETCEDIELSGLSLKDDDIASLCANLGRFKRLKLINLGDNDLSDVGGRAIAEGLMGNCSVTQVDLWGNAGLRDAVKRHITQCLLQSNGADKGIAVAGTCKFFDFETCEDIELSGLSLKDDDIASLCANLGRFQHLQSINLRGNVLSDVGGRAIAEGLMGNCGVTQVDLGRNFSLSDAAKKKILALCNRNQNERDQRDAEITAIRKKYSYLMSNAPAIDFDCSCLYDERHLLDVVRYAATCHSMHAAVVESINISHNILTPVIATELQQYLKWFPALRSLNASSNVYLGNSGVATLISSLGDVEDIDVGDCGLHGLLPTSIIARLPRLNSLACIADGDLSELKYKQQLELPPAQVCSGGIDAIKKFFFRPSFQDLKGVGLLVAHLLDSACAAVLHDDDVVGDDNFHDDDDNDDDDDGVGGVVIDAANSDDDDDDDDHDYDDAGDDYDDGDDDCGGGGAADDDAGGDGDYDVKKVAGAIIDIIKVLIEAEKANTPTMAQQLWVSLVSHKSSDDFAAAVELFLDERLDCIPAVMKWKDHSGRSAAATALSLCKFAMSSRCYFMGLYDMPDRLQHEYKSATCTVYLVDRVEDDRRTRVALKFMKNADEFEREKNCRDRLVALGSSEVLSSRDCIVETVESYGHVNAKFQAALLKRYGLTDYDNPCLFVMPAADRNLRIIMDNERITKPAAIKDLFYQIMKCTKFLHEHGHIHGDLKPRNIVRIQDSLKLIDFDACAKIGQDYSWSKHSSAYLPPEATRLSLSLRCSDFSVTDASNSAQSWPTLSFSVSFPIDIPSDSFVVITMSAVNAIALHQFTLDDVDLSCCASIDNRAIIFSSKTTLVAGNHRFKVQAAFHGNVLGATCTSVAIEHAVHSTKIISEALRASCISAIRSPMIEHAPFQTSPHVPPHCCCDRFAASGSCNGDACVPAGCTGLCGLAHVSHDMWAMGVILYRFCARQSLFSEDDEDNIKDGSGHLLELALWTDAFKNERLQKIEDTATRSLCCKLLDKNPWMRPRSIDEVFALPFNETDVIGCNLNLALQELGADCLSRLCGNPVDLVTGQLKDAAFGLRPYLKVADHWNEDAACTLQGMLKDVEILKDCPDCAQVQADVLFQLGRMEAASTRMLARALADLREQRIQNSTLSASATVEALRSDVSIHGGWHYGLCNSIKWPESSVQVKCGTFYKVFSQPMCERCQKYCLDYSSIFADLHYIMHEAAVEEKFWNGIRDQGRTGRRLAHFMALPQAVEARLTEAEMVALRFYTSHSFNSLVAPLRDRSYLSSHPLPGMVINIQRGLKKLRALGSDDASSKQTVVFWRGMRDRKLSHEFAVHGGTDVSPMSTTTDIGIAVKYCVNRAMETRSLLVLRIVTRNNLERGADVQWLSMFPGESETLFPPLTFLQRTHTPPQEVVNNGVTVTVVEVSTTLA